MATIDGGASWQQVVPDYLDALRCPSLRRCLAMSVGRGWELVGAGFDHGFVNGATPAFSRESSEMTCPSAIVCVAAGAVAGSPSGATAFLGTNGGRSWSALPLPSLMATSGAFQAPAMYYPWSQSVGDMPGYTAATCPSARHCVVLGSGAVAEVATTG